MQIFYSADFPKKIVDELRNLGYSVEPFGLKPDNGPFTGSYNLENVPERLDDKTVFLASSTNVSHGRAYSLIRHVAKTEENLEVHVADAHFDWRDKNEEENNRIGEWGFLSHVAELPSINSIYNWGCGQKYRANIEFRKKDGSHIKVLSSTILPGKETISKIRKKGKIYFSVDQDVIGSESIYPLQLTGEIELKTLVSDLLSFTGKLKPDHMDIFLDSDDSAETMRKYLFEMKLENTLKNLEILSSDTPNKKFNKFKNHVERELHTLCYVSFMRDGTIPDFLGEQSNVDGVIKNTFIADEIYLRKLANHAFYTDAKLCRYLIESMEGTLDNDAMNELFIHNIDDKTSKKLGEVHNLIEIINKEKWFGDFLPTYLSYPDLLMFVNPKPDAYIKALKEKIN